MDAFSVTVRRIDSIEPLPLEGSVDVAMLGAHRSLVKKGAHTPGELVAFIPEEAVLPPWIPRDLGLWDTAKNRGMLTGLNGCRLKARKIQGISSHGLCFPVDSSDSGHSVRLNSGKNKMAFVREGQCVSKLLGIKAFMPRIHRNTANTSFAVGTKYNLDTSAKDFDSNAHLLPENETVVVIEKVKGDQVIVVILPYSDAHPDAFGAKKNILLITNNLGEAGVALKNNTHNAEAPAVRATRALVERVDVLQMYCKEGTAAPVFIVRSVIGHGSKRNEYGDRDEFIVNSVAEGCFGRQRFFSWEDVAGDLARSFGYEIAPSLYKGPQYGCLAAEYTKGVSMLNPDTAIFGVNIIPDKYSATSSKVRIFLEKLA